MSLPELFAKFPDDDTAEAWFVEQRWPDGVHCVFCGSENVAERASRKPQPYRCRSCRRNFSVKTGSLMHASKLGCRVWVLAIYLMSTSVKGVSNPKLHRDLGVTQKTAWYLAHRIRAAWENHPQPFAGPVETDTAWIGGKAKNMHATVRRQRVHGSNSHLVPVMGVRDRPTGDVAAEAVAREDSATAREFLRDHTTGPVMVYTDDSKIYARLPRHRSVNHSRGQYVDGSCHTNRIESFWALFKRGHYGTYHQISPQHLHRYITEFCGRHNMRHLTAGERIGRVAAALDGRHLPYAELVA